MSSDTHSTPNPNPEVLGLVLQVKEFVRLAHAPGTLTKLRTLQTERTKQRAFTWFTG